MRESADKSTSYEVRRYFTPSPIPASQATKSKGRARRKPVAQPVSYQNLLDIQDRQVLQGAVKAQTAANRASVLRAFLNFNNLQLEDPVGHEFRASFSASSRDFTEHLAATGRAPRNVSNTMAALRPWRAVVVSVDTERAMAGDNLPPFNLAFRSVLKETSVQKLAGQLGIPRHMLYGWLKGKRPRLSNVAHIHRVETFFGIERGELAVLAGFAGGSHIPTTVGDSLPVGYRDGLAARTAFHYLLKPAEDSPLREQWKDFVRYKTDWEPKLTRSNSAVWRTAPFEFRRETPASWAQYLDGVEIPTAKFAWTKTASYLGWLNLPKEQSGAGLPTEDLHTLAWFAVKEHVAEYIRWMVKRNGNAYNGGTFEFIAMAMALLRNGAGYLCQQPEFMDTLPEACRGGNWEEMCRKTFSLLQALSTRYRQTRKQTRDPKEPIRHILELDNPMDMVADMVQRLRADRPLGGAPWHEAVWARDVALIKMLVSNPLRLRNLATLTWREDNSGQLYQRADGSWWIRIDRGNFKNARGAACAQAYDMPVQKMAWGDLERYLKVFRLRLLKCASDFVFVASQHGPWRRRPEDPWTEMSVRIADLTRKYLWRCPGVGAHAFRHLVATSIIKASNMTDFKTAALVLNDHLSTVEKNYAHLRSADGANRMSELLGPALGRM